MSIGIVAGTFDILHPGYICLFNKMGSLCSSIHVFLRNTAPEHKLPLIYSYLEREAQLYAIRKVELVIPYNSEEELEELILNLDPTKYLRFLDSEYYDKPAVAKDHLKTFYVNRVPYKDYKETTWSQTLIKTILRSQ